MIFVLATIELADGKRDEFLAEFHKLVPLVHEEAGCIEYGPTVDVETGIEAQQPLRANSVTVVEKWESIDALKAHLVAPHMTSYRSKVKDQVLGMRLEILEPAK